jgi:serine/threonine protein kinase
LRLHRKVAVKILTGAMFGNSEALRRFEREARASARLRHPNIITIHDYGLLATEGAYLVMDLVSGETLGARLKRERQLTPAVAAGVFEQILDGLQAAHEAGIVHRDLKPDNIFLSVDEAKSLRVHILDFGLAKLTQAADVDPHSPTNPNPAPVTRPGAVMGTLGYMSPEQLTGAFVDERSDLFSVGVMVVEAITGRRPFTGATHHELLTNILQKSYQLPSNASASAPLAAAVQKALAKDPSSRLSSAKEMRTALISALAACPPFAEQDTVILESDTHIL